MKKSYHKYLVFIFLFSISANCYSQLSEITIRFIGNCGLSLSDQKSIIYIDFPYKSGAHHYMEYDTSEIAKIKENSILIFTHKHKDHYSRKLAKKVSNKIYGPWNISELVKQNSSLENFSIEAFKTKHRFTFKHNSYLITWHNIKIYISGDTENADTIEKIKDIDWAFIPAWLLMDANERNIKIDAKKIGLYHIGPNDRITNSSPDKILLLTNTGQTIVIPY